VGSRLELEQLIRVVGANEMTFAELIDKSYDFDNAAEAFIHLWSGKHVGKIVIEIL
jgi:NADPH-dependent curcumin reductase CurA